MRSVLSVLVAATAAASCVAGIAGAQTPAPDPVAQFYRGRTVNLVIGSHVGGGNDGYGRLLARHIGRYIPGNPAVVPQNMPGAASNKAASYVYGQAPKDGSVIGAIEPSALLQPLLYDAPVGHDPSKFIFLGSANSDVYLCIVRTDAPVKSFQDAFTTELILGATAEGAKVRDLPVMLDNVLGTKFRVVTGYSGTRDVSLAIERGEVQGMCGLSWATFATQSPDWRTRGLVRILVQEDMTGLPEMNKLGVPRTADFAKTEQDRQVMELIYSQGRFGRPFVLPPGTPADRTAALRGAFMATLRDKDFLTDAKNSRLDITPMGGDELQALMAKLYALPPQVAERARQSLILKRTGR